MVSVSVDVLGSSLPREHSREGDCVLAQRLGLGGVAGHELAIPRVGGYFN